MSIILFLLHSFSHACVAASRKALSLSKMVYLSQTTCTASRTPILEKTIKTPIGEYLVAVCGKGVHSIEALSRDDVSFAPDPSIHVMDADDKIKQTSTQTSTKYSNVTRKDPRVYLQNLVEWFHLYFHDTTRLEAVFPNAVEICVQSATDFQKRVWETLKGQVGLGCTISYGELAVLAGCPRAARAVGSAMKNNPNPLLVPCHRVLKSNSVIGNYNGGPKKKEWLLNHEKAAVEIMAKKG